MFSIFSAALGDIWSRRRSAATLLLLPLLANVLAELNFTKALIETEYIGGTTASFVAFFVNMLAIVFIAVNWHRIVLLDENAQVIPPARGAMYVSYFVSWFVMGLIIAAALLVIGVGLYFASVLLAGNSRVFDEAFFNFIEGSDVFGGGPGFMLMFVSVVVFLLFLFRCGVLLPNLALGGSYMSMRSAWVLTRPQAGKILGVAIVAGFFQSLAFALPVLFYDSTYDVDTGETILWAEYLLAVVNIVIYTVSTLIGAAILTAIYKRVDPAALAKG